ncbi:hypothetical protein ABZ092_30485 [Streptomyces bobili]|uniref:hypothetical protein n=1 Tax=Streptomyces bobili TaxID=67280 RepID=UPI0033BDB1DA
MAPEEEPSRAAGGCVLVVLGGALVAVAFAVDEAAGVLLVVASGAVALWRSARRLSVSSATPPPGDAPLLDGERAVQELADGTTLVNREGMSIFLKDDPRTPGRTRVRVVPAAEEEVSQP